MPQLASPSRHLLATADRLHSAAIHLVRHLRSRDAERGAPVGPAGLSALSVLVSSGPRTVGELARAEHVKVSTMSRLVASLERYGMVTRAADPSDRRSVVVRPTSVGRTVMRRGREGEAVALASLLGDLAQRDIEALGRAAELIERMLRADRTESG
jgi:DNA-binding MarR family transcriptional regulator